MDTMVPWFSKLIDDDQQLLGQGSSEASTGRDPAPSEERGISAGAGRESVVRASPGDWWPYGLKANRKMVDTFLRYHFEQGLSKRRMTCEDIFVPDFLQS